MQIVIDIPNSTFTDLKKKKNRTEVDVAVLNGTPLPKHGRLIDIGKIDKDRIESDNPIIYLTINGEYTEAISLDYLNSIPTIIEADTESEGEG